MKLEKLSIEASSANRLACISWKTLGQVQLKFCACGCGLSFVPSRYNQRYFDRRHCKRAKRKRYEKKHNVHTEYRSRIICPKCGSKGDLFERVRDQGIVISSFVHHVKKVYSPYKYRKWRQQGLTSKEAQKKTRTITKHVRNCWL